MSSEIMRKAKTRCVELNHILKPCYSCIQAVHDLAIASQAHAFDARIRELEAGKGELRTILTNLVMEWCPPVQMSEIERDTFLLKISMHIKVAREALSRERPAEEE